MCKKKKGSNGLADPLRAQKKERAEQTDANREQCDLVWRNRGGRKTTGNSQRNRPFDVPRHKSVGIFDESAQQATLCVIDISWCRDDQLIDRRGNCDRRSERLR